jgi:hypothetical protein
MSATTGNAANLWRLESPSHSGWPRTARAGDPPVYFIWLERMGQAFHPRLARYPRHTWPHCAEAIERTMGGLTDGPRAKVLGRNAARFFGFEVPERSA